MSKRYSDTEIWNEDWFIALSPAHMLFWKYVTDKCDHAGVFKVNTTMFKKLTGMDVDTTAFLQAVNSIPKTSGEPRIQELKNGYWYLTGFVSFHYGLKPNINNRVHRSVIDILLQYGIEDSIWTQVDPNLNSSRGQLDPIEGLKDKDKDKDISFNINKESWILKLIAERLPRVGKLSTQPTAEDCKKLEAMFSVKDITDILWAMENYKPLLKNYQSVYLTMLKWLQREGVQKKVVVWRSCDFCYDRFPETSKHFTECNKNPLNMPPPDGDVDQKVKDAVVQLSASMSMKKLEAERERVRLEHIKKVNDEMERMK